MDDSRKLHFGWLVLLSCLGFYALTTGALCNTAGIFLSPVMKEMGWTRTSASFYLTIFPLVAAVLQPIVGKVYQKYNPRYILPAMVLIFGMAYMLTSKATTVLHWNAFGVIYGITAGFFMYIPTPWLINNWFHKRAGLCLGITGAALSIFAAFANPIGNNLITAYGWRTARLIMGGVITIIAVPLSYLFTIKSPSEKGLKPYGYGEAGMDSKVPVETETSGVPIGMAIKSPAFYLVILIAGIFCMTASFFQQIPSYAVTGELGAAAGAFAVSIVMFGGIIGKFVLGWLNDTIGIKLTGIIACIGGAAGILLAFLAGSNVNLFYLGLAFFGFGYSALTIVSPMVTKGAFGPRDYSQIYSWITMSIFLFSSAAPLLYAQIYDITGGFSVAFVLVVAMYLLAAILIPITLAMGEQLKKSANQLNTNSKTISS